MFGRLFALLKRVTLSDTPGWGLRALLVVSLLPVSEINQRFRPGIWPGRRRDAGAGYGASEGSPRHARLCLATRSDAVDHTENE